MLQASVAHEPSEAPPVTLDTVQKELVRRYNNGRVENMKKVVSRDGKEYDLDGMKMILLTDIGCHHLNRVVIRESNVHGSGVFATENIRKGELITLYPGDVVDFFPNEGQRIEFRSISDREKQVSADGVVLLSPDYSISGGKGYSVFGDPRFTRNPSYLGHMVNDGSTYNPDSETAESYRERSQEKANCYFRSISGLHIATIAGRDIKEGEELFASYGHGYWRVKHERQPC